MAVRIGNVAVAGVSAGGIAADEIADPVGASGEVVMQSPDAGIDDVGVDAGAGAGRAQPCIEWERALVEAVEPPGEAGRRQRRERQGDGGNRQPPAYWTSADAGTER